MPDSERIQVTLPADKKYLKLIGTVVQEICGQVPSLSAADGYHVQLAVDEAVATTISQAYKDDASQKVEITFEVLPDRLVVQVRDWGKSFDPSALPEPDLDHLHEQSYGVFLVRLMDSVSYRADPVHGNCVTLVKKTR